MRKLIVISGVLILCMIASGGAYAEQPGLSVGVMTGYTGLTGDLKDNFNGDTPVGVRAGFWMDENMEAELSYFHNQFSPKHDRSGHLELDALELAIRGQYTHRELIRPYIKGGAGYYIYNATTNTPAEDATSFGLLAGAGVDFVHLLSKSSEIGVGLEGKYSFIFKNETNGIDMGSNLYQVGFSLFLNF